MTDIESIINSRAFEAQLPKRLQDLVDSERLLMPSEQQRVIKDLELLIDRRRIDLEANLLVHLSVALIKQNRQVIFLEKAVQDLCKKNISLRTDIAALKILIAEGIEGKSS